MGTRKNAASLTPTERDNFLRAVLTLKNTIANPGAPVGQQISIYDQFVALHLYTLSINVPGGGIPINMGHLNSGFGPWHRYYLLRFEQALQQVDPTVNLPYWNWTDHSATQNIIFQDNFIGPNGGAGGVGGGTVQSGYFAFDAPGTGSNPTPSPAWWPAGLAGWRPRPSLQQGHGNTLVRALGLFSNLATKPDVLTTLNKTTYEGSSTGFRPALEGGLRMHNYHHVWVGGNMSDPLSSPNDLIFFLHHCNLDRLWAMWQINGHQGSAFYPASGRPQGHNLADPMWPWIGTLSGYSSNNAQADVVLPDFTGEPVRTPNDVLDHRSLGYSYDTEVVLAIALDQTGSMTGITPDPMTAGAPDVSKWEAAKRGIAALLHDSELAFSAGEAYVTAGIKTFRTLTSNVYTQVFLGTPYGLIKNGTIYSEVGFTGSIAPFTPDGSTPLAGALTDTENTLVRPPFGNMPPNDTRYLLILTDGMETAAPPLSTISSGSFLNTVIFAMGFGVGSGWDGVDYATIANLVAKGKAAPTSVSQVFHGENAGVIDKFYTNSIAHVIGYTPSIDPILELFPGEHSDVPFHATDADESFMITAQGFDFSDDNWEFCLVTPNGTHCGESRDEPQLFHHHEGGEIEQIIPFFITSRKSNGRCTIFLDRNGADSSLWVGRWYLRAMYKMETSDMSMFMPSLWDMIIPVGSPPVRGPLYARLNQSPSNRSAVRIIPRKGDQPFFQTAQGISSGKTESPCSVSVNVYSKTSIQSGLQAEVKEPIVGNDFDVIMTISDRGSNVISDLKVTARLVAPKHSIGNAFADLKTIPLQARSKYLDRNNQGAPFNQAQFLADYEQKKPGVFPIRDEIIDFKQSKKDSGILRAHIKGNIYPGVYRVAVYTEGTIGNGKVEPARFSRVIQTEVALGIQPDPKRSKPEVRLVTPNKLLVSVTPTDKYGNIASPANILNPIVTMNGTAVRGKHVNLYTGEHQIEIALKGKGIRLNTKGTKIIEGEATIETETDEKLFLKRGESIKVNITISNKTLIASYSGSKNKLK